MDIPDIEREEPNLTVENKVEKGGVGPKLPEDGLTPEQLADLRRGTNKKEPEFNPDKSGPIVERNLKDPTPNNPSPAAAAELPNQIKKNVVNAISDNPSGSQSRGDR